MVKARATAVRLAPAGRAVLVLGVAAVELAGRRFTMEGRRISAIRVGRVALLIAYVERDAFSPDELQSLRTDPSRLALEARSYQRAIERAAVHAPIVPAGLLTVFADMAAIDALPPERLSKWARQLARLGERRECAISCYAGPHAMPVFDPYPVAVASRALRAQKPDFGGDAAIAPHLEAVWQSIAPFAMSSRRLKTISARERFATSILIEPTAIDRLRATLAERSAEASSLGITWYCEGPRLPFSFV